MSLSILAEGGVGWLSDIIPLAVKDEESPRPFRFDLTVGSFDPCEGFRIMQNYSNKNIIFFLIYRIKFLNFEPHNNHTIDLSSFSAIDCIDDLLCIFTT